MFSRFRNLKPKTIIWLTLIVGVIGGGLLGIATYRNIILFAFMGGLLCFSVLSFLSTNYLFKIISVNLYFFTVQALPMYSLFTLQSTLAEIVGLDNVTPLRLPVIAVYYASITMLAVILYNLLSYITPYGSSPWNLFVSYTLYTVGTLTLLSILGYSYYLLASIVGFVLGLLWFVFRKIFTRKRKPETLFKLEEPSKKSVTSVENILSRQGYKTVIGSDNTLIATLEDDQGNVTDILNIIVTESTNIQLLPTGVFIDKTNVIPFLEKKLLSMKSNRVIPTVYLLSTKNELEQPTQRLMIPRWNQPYRFAGECYIQTLKGFRAFVTAKSEQSLRTSKRQLKRNKIYAERITLI